MKSIPSLSLAVVLSLAACNAGSAATAATALLGLTQKLKPDELAALERAIDQARERGS